VSQPFTYHFRQNEIKRKHDVWTRFLHIDSKSLRFMRVLLRHTGDKIFKIVITRNLKSYTEIRKVLNCPLTEEIILEIFGSPDHY